MGSCNLVPAVSPMSGSPSSDTEKRKIERGEFITPHALRAGGVKTVMTKTKSPRFDFGNQKMLKQAKQQQ